MVVNLVKKYNHLSNIELDERFYEWYDDAQEVLNDILRIVNINIFQ